MARIAPRRSIRQGKSVLVSVRMNLIGSPLYHVSYNFTLISQLFKRVFQNVKPFFPALLLLPKQWFIIKVLLRQLNVDNTVIGKCVVLPIIAYTINEHGKKVHKK